MKKSAIRTLCIVVSIVTIIILAVFALVFNQNIIIPSITSLVFIILLVIMYNNSENEINDNIKAIENSIETSVSELIKEGSIGLIVYNDDYEITWMSPFFRNRNINKTNEKILTWLPELQDILQGNEDRQVVSINNETFSVSKKDNSNFLLFKDISLETKLSKRIEEEAYVLGMINFDNYDEYRDNDDEVTFINSYIKVPVINYLKEHDIVYKSIRSNRMILILNEKNYKELEEDKFSIINLVRQEAKKADIGITLSIAFARGSQNLDELDGEVQSLMELAQTRGGDQVVSRVIGKEVSYFGGSSEAKEKRSRVKVRVIVNSIKNLINNSSNVIIVGHKEMDSDCVGSALGASDMVLSLDKPSYIVARSGGIESMISDVVFKYSHALNAKHKLISENEAMQLLNDDTLVIMVDHHDPNQSNGSELLKKAKKIVIIDHHRRKADLSINPLMLYVEAAASSTTELITEFIPYLPKKFDISEQEANIMYLGILIDTDRFRVRTNARTFDVLKTLRTYGADPSACDLLAEEPYANVLARTQIINAAKQYREDIVISSMSEGTYQRSIASQACDQLVKIKEIEAAFCVCLTANNEVIVTARSNGGVNVQTIMEKMHGGGHMTAAGLQRKDTTVNRVSNELINVLNELYKGESNESNIVE